MLVRMGLRHTHDPRILNTLRVIDGELKRNTATGDGWVRSSFDGYGEHSDGAPFNGRGIGRCWPLLAGERGHYAVAAGDRDTALETLRTMARQCSECGMLPEQVWDQADIPERELYNGHPTGSGMPLAWAHAEYLKLLRSLHDGKVWDMPDTTRRRYLEDETNSDIVLWSPHEGRARMPAGRQLQVMVEYGGAIQWTGPDEVRRETPLQERPLGFYTARLPTADLPTGSTIDWELTPDDQEFKPIRNRVTIA
jgi:glucoamylase